MSAPDSLTVRESSRGNDLSRWHGLDWLRAGAAVLVVALHAGIAYLVVPMPGLAWATHDAIGSPVVDRVTWWINGFIMPLFFVQSGFLAGQIMHRKGPREFLRHRTRRLLAPFALGCVLILPLDLYAWLLGWAADGRISLRKLRSLKIESPLGDNLWGVSHLWYLEYLWLFCAVAGGVCLVAGRLRSRRAGENCQLQMADRRSQISNLPIAISSVVLMSASAVALWWEPRVLIGFRHSWWPLPANLMFYGPWFALGWLAYARMAGLLVSAHPQAMNVRVSVVGDGTAVGNRLPMPFTQWCEWRVAASVAAFTSLLPLIHRHVTTETAGLERAMLVGLFVLHAWLIVTGLFGAAVKWLNRRPPRSVTYLAEASFWIYLFHHPVVGLTQVSLSQAALPLVGKFGLTLLTGVVLPLLTYQAFVRRTWIGVVLNGRRLGVDERRDSPDLLPLPIPEPARLRKSA